MKNYGDTLSAVVTALKNATATIGVPVANIIKGEPGTDMPMMPPFVYVYLLPNDANLLEFSKIATINADLLVFVGSDFVADGTTADNSALAKAMELASKVVNVVQKMDMIGLESFSLDEYTSTHAVIELKFRCKILL